MRDDEGPHARAGGGGGIGEGADGEVGAFGEGVADEGVVLLDAGGGDQHRGGAGGGEDVGDGLGEVRGEGVGDRGVHDNALGGHADLAALQGTRSGQFLRSAGWKGGGENTHMEESAESALRGCLL